jgi:hypothetical protein
MFRLLSNSSAHWLYFSLINEHCGDRSVGIEPAEDENGEDAVHDKINQDRGCVVYPYRASDKESLFLVLDGHGEQGDRVSEFVMRQVL